MKSTDPVDNLINILSVDCLNCSIAGMGFDLHGEKEGIKKNASMLVALGQQT